MGILTRIKQFFAEDSERSVPILLPGSRADWSLTRPLHLVSSVNACLQWLSRNFTEAPMLVERSTSAGWLPEPDHPLMDLFRRPNSYHTMEQILIALIRDYFVYGNAYLYINRDSNSKLELWYLPASSIQIKGGQSMNELIVSYHYRAARRVMELSTDSVIHLRAGIDPERPAYGLSPLQPVLRELAADAEIMTYIVSILRNLGVPGAVISPKSSDTFISSEQAELVKQLYQRRTAGDERGQALVMTTPTDVHYPNVSPENLAISTLHRIPESRVAAAFGLPAVVVGLLVGLEETATYNNIREAREAAWEECILPLQRQWSSVLTQRLAPPGHRIVFDIRQVRALQTDRSELVTQLNAAVQGGWLTVAEARQQMGLESDDSQRVFLRPASMAEWSATGEVIDR